MDHPEVDVLVGLDVGKADHHATGVNLAGERLLTRPVGNDQASIKALIDAARVHGTPALVIDQPGSIAALVLAVARAHQVPVAYVPGLVMRRAADLYEGEAKTDPRDSYVLADTARVHRRRLRWLDVSDDTLAELRVLSGYDDDLAADVVRTANRLRDTLTAVNPQLEQAVGARLDHPAVRALLARYPTPAALRQAGRARIERTLKAKAPRLAVRLAAQVVEAVAAQTVTVPGEAVLGRVITDLAGELDRLHARRDALVADMEAAFLTHPLGPVLVTLPGVGPRTGAKILAEVGDGGRFASGSQLASYAGLAPVTRQSGSSVRGESRSRRGNHRLKNALFLAAFCSLRSPDSKAYYQRKRAEGKRHNAAVICLARRRCDVILAMLRTATPYQPAIDTGPDDLPAAA